MFKLDATVSEFARSALPVTHSEARNRSEAGLTATNFDSVFYPGANFECPDGLVVSTVIVILILLALIVRPVVYLEWSDILPLRITNFVTMTNRNPSATVGPRRLLEPRHNLTSSGFVWPSSTSL